MLGTSRHVAATSSGGADAGSAGAGNASASAIGSGSVSSTVVPTPCRLRISTAPPIISARRRQMASPRPVPPYCRAVSTSAWLNGWNSSAWCSGDTPTPVSCTEMQTRSLPSARSSSSARISIEPREVNLIALLTRLLRICRSRSGSTSTAGLMRASVLLCMTSPLLLALPA